MICWHTTYEKSWHTLDELEAANVKGLDAVYKRTNYYMPLPKKSKAVKTKKKNNEPSTPAYVQHVTPPSNFVFFPPTPSSTPPPYYSYSWDSIYSRISYTRRDITDGITPPSSAEVCENVSTTTKLSRMGPHRPNPKNLADAIQRGCAEEVQRLIRAGAQVNRQFGYIGKEHEIFSLIFSGQPGQFPLGWALTLQHLHIADILLDNGARLEARDNSGRDAASYYKDPNAFRLYAKKRFFLVRFKLFYCKFFEEDYPLDIIRYILAKLLIMN